MATFLVFGSVAYVLPAPPAGATDVSLIHESFSGAATAADGSWAVGGSTSPCLTAASSSTKRDIPFCSSSAIDSPGSGALRLTSTKANQSAFATYASPISTANGLDISFDSYQYGGGGADGIGLVLTNGSSPYTTKLTQGSTFGYIHSVSHALLGVGLDAYGGWSKPSGADGCSAVAGIATGSTLKGIAVRGPGEPGVSGSYCLLARSAQIFHVASTSRPAYERRVRVVVDPPTVSNPKVDVYVNDVRVVQIAQPNALRSASTVRLAFTASTGGTTDIHEVRNVEMKPVFVAPAASSTIATPTTVSTTSSPPSTAGSMATSTTSSTSTSSTTTSTATASTVTPTTTSSTSTSSTTSSTTTSSTTTTSTPPGSIPSTPATSSTTVSTPTTTPAPSQEATNAPPVGIAHSPNVFLDPITGLLAIPPGRRPTGAHASVLYRGTGALTAFPHGSVVASGTAHAHGDVAHLPLNASIATIFSANSDNGYYLAARDGGVFAFGDAAFKGSMAGAQLSAPIVSGAVCGNGYWLAGEDGGVFSFGDVPFLGSMATKPLNQPVVSIVATSTCNGYWLVAADGGVFAHGDAPFLGSIASQKRRDVTGFAYFPHTHTYSLVLENGTIVRVNFDD